MYTTVRCGRARGRLGLFEQIRQSLLSATDIDSYLLMHRTNNVSYALINNEKIKLTQQHQQHRELVHIKEVNAVTKSVPNSGSYQ